MWVAIPIHDDDNDNGDDERSTTTRNSSSRNKKKRRTSASASSSSSPASLSTSNRFDPGIANIENVWQSGFNSFLFDEERIKDETYVRICQPNYIPTTDTILRAKWKNFSESLETWADYGDIFSFSDNYPFLDPEILIRTASRLHLMTPNVQSGELLLEPNPSLLPYWSIHKEPIDIRRHSYYCSVLLRVNIAYLAAKRILTILISRGQKVRVSIFPQEIACLLRAVDEMSSTKTSTKGRTAVKVDMKLLDQVTFSTIEHGVFLYQLRAFILEHGELMKFFGSHQARLDDAHNKLDELITLYELDERQYPIDYPLYSVQPTNKLWVPKDAIFTVYNSKLTLYAKMLRATDSKTAAAVLPVELLGRKIQRMICMKMPFVNKLRKEALEWYRSNFAINDVPESMIGSIALAIYYSVKNVEFYLSSEQQTNANIDLHFACWLHIMNYIDIVRCFQRIQMLTDNAVPAYLIHLHSPRIFSELTLSGDKTVLSRFDREYAPFMKKFSLVKQLIKAFFPQKNLGRDLPKAIEENLIAEQEENETTNNKQLPFYRHILGLLLCTFTGGYKRTKYRIPFDRAVAVYTYFTSMRVEQFASCIGKLEQPIRFILREYVRFISLSTSNYQNEIYKNSSSRSSYGDDSSEQRHINYMTIHRATVNVCNYMRTVIREFKGDMDSLCRALIDATASVTSSQQSGPAVKAICGVVHRDLRKLGQPLVSVSKGSFPEFLLETIYTILQNNYVNYMMIHEEAESLAGIIDDCKNLVNEYAKAETIREADLDALLAKLPRDKLVEIQLDVSDHAYRFKRELHFPKCLTQLSLLERQCKQLLEQLEQGKLIYILSPKEKTEILKLLLNPDEEATETIVNWFSPMAQVALEDINKKCEQCASEKSAAQLVAAHFNPIELARVYFLLNCRQVLMHRIVEAPRSLERQTMLAMHTMRLFVNIPGVPDNAFDVQFMPCCNRIATFSKEHKMGNDLLVYNPNTYLFECSNVPSPKQTAPVLLRPNRFMGLVPYYGTISRDKKSNRRKLARLALQNNVRIACDGTPAYPICLKNKRLLFNVGDGETIVYYHCPTCARLTKQPLHSKHVTLGMCKICRRCSIFALYPSKCYFCHNYFTSKPVTAFIIDEARPTDWIITTICQICWPYIRFSYGDPQQSVVKSAKGSRIPRIAPAYESHRRKHFPEGLVEHYRIIPAPSGHPNSIPVVMYREKTSQ